MTVRIIRNCDGPEGLGGCGERVELHGQPVENIGARVFCRRHRAEGTDVWGGSQQWGRFEPVREFGLRSPVAPSNPLPAPRPLSWGRIAGLGAAAALPGGFLGYLAYRLARRARERRA